jgi:predicted nucleic acid-binding protein
MELSRSLSPDRIVTTDEVLCEYLAFFASARPAVRAQACQNVADLITNPAVFVVPQSRDSFLAGLELYRARPDKGYSLTDCISMQTMRQHGLTEVLTNDRHFEQEGFRALFRD